MTPQEKYLYHQIHPLKLLTDWISGVIALYRMQTHASSERLVEIAALVMISVINLYGKETY